MRLDVDCLIIQSYDVSNKSIEGIRGLSITRTDIFVILLPFWQVFPPRRHDGAMDSEYCSLEALSSRLQEAAAKVAGGVARLEEGRVERTREEGRKFLS